MQLTDKIRVTKSFTFDMAHALYGYDGPCKNIHGHTYVLSVTLLGTILHDEKNPKNGMVIDFTDLKNIVKTHVINEFDHSLVLNSNSPQALMNELNSSFDKINFVNYQPSCENLLLDFLHKIQPHLPTSIKIHTIKLQETPTSYAEWFAEDN